MGMTQKCELYKYVLYLGLLLLTFSKTIEFFKLSYDTK